MNICAAGVPSKLKHGDVMQFGTDSQVEVEVRSATAPRSLIGARHIGRA